jgi:hypothetical protein
MHQAFFTGYGSQTVPTGSAASSGHGLLIRQLIRCLARSVQVAIERSQIR